MVWFAWTACPFFVQGLTSMAAFRYRRLYLVLGDNIIIQKHKRIIIYSYLSRDIPTDLSVFLQGALTKYLIECVEHEVMWHCEYQEEQSST